MKVKSKDCMSIQCIKEKINNKEHDDVNEEIGRVLSCMKEMSAGELETFFSHAFRIVRETKETRQHYKNRKALGSMLIKLSEKKDEQVRDEVWSLVYPEDRLDL